MFFISPGLTAEEAREARKSAEAEAHAAETADRLQREKEMLECKRQREKKMMEWVRISLFKKHIIFTVSLPLKSKVRFLHENT